jgi:flotillin
VLLAEVAPQITLAKEIGGNEGYQRYLINIKQVEAGQAIGVANAEALEAADIKVFATGGNAQSGMSSITDIFTPAGGLSIGSMLAGIAATDEGKKAVERLTETVTPKGGKKQPTREPEPA